MKYTTIRKNLLLIGYTIVSAALFFYSYTQVDLNLTLTRVDIWQSIQKAFQYIGYFERPTSTVIFLVILAIFFLLYVVCLRLSKLGRLSTQEVWKMTIVAAMVLVWSYPAFSYDIFNHMFTAKTVLLYHKSPYEVIPLQFAGIDPWLGFMRWTHIVSIYSPFWIALTLTPYLLGFGYFLIILFNTKLMLAGFYLVTVWFIVKSLEVHDKKNATLGMVFFALNPLVIIESLVSAHNDIAMMAFAMGAYYLTLTNKRIISFLFLSLSIATKLMTIFLLPAFFLGWNKKFVLGSMLVGLALLLLRREVLPWYALWILPFVAIQPGRKELVVVSVGASLGLLFRYAPFLYLGHWNDPVPTIKDWVTLLPIVVSLVGLFVYHIIKWKTHKI